MWQVVNQIAGKKQDRTISEIKYKGNTTNDSLKIAQIFNTNFKEKISNLKKGLQEPNVPYVNILKNIESSVPILQFKEISRTKMDLIVKELKLSGANGCDGINARVIKDIYSEWHQVFLHLANISLCTGIFPEILKHTKILPQLKSGKEPTDPMSYRPISSLPMLGKIIERSGYDQLSDHCETNQLISEHQHGGRAKHSTTTCLLELNEHHQKAKATKMKSALLGVDLSAAYDLVSHQVIDQQLRLVGADNLVRKWSRSFLGGRKQLVEINGQSSQLINSLDMGLCQGGRSSGPLFSIHTNGIPRAVQGHFIEDNIQTPTQIGNDKKIVKLFVDDTTGLAVAKTYQSLSKLLQEMYDNLEIHLIQLGMAINPSKTQLMIFNPNPQGKLISITAGGAQIKHQCTLKVLGFTFSEDGKMDEFLWRGDQSIVRSLQVKQSLLRKIKPYTTPKQIGQIANAIINSQILYLAPLWTQTTQGNISKIQKAQTRVLRQITWSRRIKFNQKQHRQALFTDWGWMNTKQLTQNATNQVVRKAVRNQSTSEINQMFHFNDQSKSRIKNSSQIKTENTNKRHSPNLLDIGRNGYNNLPLHLRDLSLNIFLHKKKSKIEMFKNFHLTEH